MTSHGTNNTPNRAHADASSNNVARTGALQGLEGANVPGIPKVIPISQEESDDKRTRYAKALGANWNTDVYDITHLEGCASRPSELMKLTGGPKHSDGSMKRYSLVEYSNGYFAEINEVNDRTHYIIQLRDDDFKLVPSKSGKIATESLENLVKKHIDVAGSPKERIEAIKKELKQHEIETLLTMHTDLERSPRATRSSQIVSQTFGIDFDDEKSRYNAGKYALVSAEILERYPIELEIVTKYNKGLKRAFLLEMAELTKSMFPSLRAKITSSLFKFAIKRVGEDRVESSWEKIFPAISEKLGPIATLKRLHATKERLKSQNAE